jgi:4-carboxymuconolactone decarboxylase
MSRDPAASQKAIGDFAPKLPDLTDRVLFGDVCKRDRVSQRLRR